MPVNAEYRLLFPAAIAIATVAMAFTIPGVLVGGQLGPMVHTKVDPDRVKPRTAVLLIDVGVFTLFTVL